MNSSPSMVQTLAQRLAEHPPFDGLSSELLTKTAASLRVRYLEADEVIFNEGEPARPEIYLLKRGTVAITRQDGDASVLVDLCDEGDLFGVRAQLADRPYAARAQAKEVSLLYVIPSAQLTGLMEADPKVALFFAADFAADLPSAQENRLEAVAAAREGFRSERTLSDPLTPVAPTRDVVSCASDTTIQAAAQKMQARGVGSIIVTDASFHPIGIVTDADLRAKVVAAAMDVSRPISEIMSAPVVTIEDGTSEATLIAIMMQRKLHHFAVTKDGTDRSAVVGVISEHDIWKTRGNHPTVILTEMRRAKTGDALKRLRDQAEDLLRDYLRAETSMTLVARVVSEINDALIQRALALALDELERAGRSPPCDFCWLALGSEGREEQLLRTDQDNALLWDDGGTNDEDGAQAYFLELGGRVVEYLVQSGFERCPGDVMASFAEWNRSLTRWKEQFHRWIVSPDPQATMRSNITFDFRPVGGQFELARRLKNYVLDEVKKDRAFLTFFAHAAVQNPPPLSFFRNEIVEKSGEHRSTFDIKGRAMMPLADAARVLTYDLAIDMYGSTADRWRHIAETEPNLARVAKEAAMAYEIMMRVRALEGLQRGDSGRYVHIQELSKLERQTLRNTFLVVEDVQLMLRSRFRLDMLR